jgi:hypothetical protein
MGEILKRIAVCFPAYPILLIASLLISSVALAQEPKSTKPWTSVTYTEYPVGGYQVDKGRSLSTDGSANYGIDINSKIAIKIDNNKLRESISPLLLSQEDRKYADDLIVVLDKLTTVSKTVEAAVFQTTDTISSYQIAVKTGNDQEFKAKAKLMANTIKKLMGTLREARLNRLLLDGVPKKDAELLSKTMFTSVLQRGNDPYNWNALGALFSEEITASQKNYDKIMLKLGAQLEIKAYLMSKDGQIIPVYVPGYNTVETGPAAYYTKMKYEVPQDQIDIYKKNVELAKSIGEAKDVGEALIKQIEVEFATQIATINQLSSSVDSELKSEWVKFTALAKWKDVKLLEAWQDSIKAELNKTQQGIKVIEQITVVKEDIAKINNFADFLKELSEVHNTLGKMDSVQALQYIVGMVKKYSDLNDGSNPIAAITQNAWVKYKGDITTLITDVEKLDSATQILLKSGGPIDDLKALIGPIDKIVAALGGNNEDLVSLFSKLLGISPAVMAADLPVPKGLKHVDVNADMNTSIDLTTIKQSRTENDTLEIQYKIFHGDQAIGDIWTDRFKMRVFGWYDNFFAGLAFVQQNNQNSWKPTATLSWIISHRSWPNSKESGLSGIEGFEIFSGLGITTMPLNFTGNQNVEVGLAPTISLLNNRLLFGYGVDLQASRNVGFCFFSIRLLGNSGFLPK